MKAKDDSGQLEQQQRDSREGHQIACDPIAALHQEHEGLRDLFRQAEASWSAADTASRETLIARLCRRLDMHAELEEELVYPVLAAEPETSGLAAGAQDDHANMKAMIRQLESASAADDECLAMVRILAAAFDKHAAEEEETLLPGLSRAGVGLHELGERMARRKSTLQEEMVGVKPS